MTLDRAHLTTASRIMLPAYVGLATSYGLVYLFDPLHRLHNSHALTAARDAMGGSMKPWGLLFLTLSLVMFLAFRRDSRAGFLLALAVFAGAWGMWAVLSAISVKTDAQASILSPAPPLFYLTACIATMRSLLAREV